MKNYHENVVHINNINVYSIVMICDDVINFWRHKIIDLNKYGGKSCTNNTTYVRLRALVMYTAINYIGDNEIRIILM